MLYKHDFYRLILEKVPTIVLCSGDLFSFTSYGTSVHSLDRSSGQTCSFESLAEDLRQNNVPPSRFCPSKTQSVPARLRIHTPVRGVDPGGGGGGGGKHIVLPPNNFDNLKN